MLSFYYQNRSAVGGQRGHMLLHARPNRGVGVLCRWWGCTLSVAEAEVKAKREVGENCE